jgi:hypothetical protein
MNREEIIAAAREVLEANKDRVIYDDADIDTVGDGHWVAAVVWVSDDEEKS